MYHYFLKLARNTKWFFLFRHIKSTNLSVDHRVECISHEREPLPFLCVSQNSSIFETSNRTNVLLCCAVLYTAVCNKLCYKTQVQALDFTWTVSTRLLLLLNGMERKVRDCSSEILRPIVWLYWLERKKSTRGIIWCELTDSTPVRQSRIKYIFF